MDTLTRRPYTDDARRMADTMNLHAVMKSKGWAVFALADGRSPDLTPYPDIGEAYRAMKWDRDNLPVPSDSSLAGFTIQRKCRHAWITPVNCTTTGYRLPDPRDFNAPDRDFPVHQPPVMKRDWARQINAFTRGK